MLILCYILKCGMKILHNLCDLMLNYSVAKSSAADDFFFDEH